MGDDAMMEKHVLRETHVVLPASCEADRRKDRSVFCTKIELNSLFLLNSNS
jgi:hypothetical protein